MRLWTSLFKRFSQQSIKNDGSQARDHLANERTFLAWTRTSVGFAAMALALGRLDYIDQILHSSAVTRFKNPDDPVTIPSRDSKPGTRRPSVDILGLHVNAPHAPTLCSAISAWCLGFGLVRYLGGTRRLLQNQFLPARNGPVALALGSAALFGAMMFNHDIHRNQGEEKSASLDSRETVGSRL